MSFLNSDNLWAKDRMVDRGGLLKSRTWQYEISEIPGSINCKLTLRGREAT
jgi:hypothetical protein